MAEVEQTEPQPVETPPNPAPKTSSARHTLNIFTTRLFVLPLTLLTSILVIRALGPGPRGIYGFLVLQGSLVLPLLTLGFGASATYFVSKKRYTVNQVFVTCLSVALLQGAIGSLLLGTLWYLDLLGATARVTSGVLMLPVLIVLPLQGAILALTRLALGDSWFSLNNRVQLAQPLLTAFWLWVLVLFGGWGVEGTVAGIVATNVIIFTGALIAFLRRYRPERSINTGYVREASGYGVKAWPADVAVITNGRMDQYALGVLAEPTALGIYGPIVLISELLWTLPDAVSFVLQNKIAAAHDPQEQVLLVDRLTRIMFWAMAAGAVVVALAAPPFMVAVWGPKYADSRLPLTLLLIGTVAFCICKVVTKYFAGTGRPHHSATCVIVGAAVGFPLYWLLIPRYGIVGAAAAHAACYTVTSLTAMLIYRKLVAPHRPQLLRPEMADVTWIEQQARLAIRARQHAGG